MSLHHAMRSAAGASPADPNFSNVSLLLLGNGTNGAQNNTFTDSSSNGFTVTRYGNTTQGSFSPFPPAAGVPYKVDTHGGSGYFDGSGDYLATPWDQSIEFGSGDFTVELWFYPKEVASGGQVVTSVRSGSANYGFAIYQNATTMELYLASNNSSWNITSGLSIGTVAANSWYHVAVSRSGTSIKTFLNGVAGGTVTTSASIYAWGTSLLIGAAGGSPFGYITGYISSLRILKGTAQYTAAFTPPTAPLTAITNTSLLLNFVNAGILDSTAKNDLETVGDVQISTSTKKFGTGSLKFDGTGDYLALTGNAGFNFGTGAFTIEMFFRIATGASGSPYGKILVSNENNNWASGAFALYGLANSTQFRPSFWINEYSSSTPLLLPSSGDYRDDAWHHLAIVRDSSGSTKMYIDGTEAASGTHTGNCGSSTRNVLVGYNLVTDREFAGYIDDLRITKGVARYTANFTPPTAQLPSR